MSVLASQARCRYAASLFFESLSTVAAQPPIRGVAPGVAVYPILPAILDLFGSSMSAIAIGQLSGCIAIWPVWNFAQAATMLSPRTSLDIRPSLYIWAQ